jgi:1-deoxyxylulose-5-phosphate synthase
MRYRQLGSAGLRVSELCLGTVYFGTQVTPEESERIIRRAPDLGMNFVDTAEIYMRPRYGASEEIVGKALVGRRHEVVLATKKRYDPGIFRTGTPADHSLSRSQIIAAIEGSLRRLQTDYVDLYYPHHVDLVVSLEETLRAIDDLVRAGKVRYVGLSNHPTWKVIRALWIADRLGLAPIIASQALYNLLDRAIERELILASQQFGLGIVAYSPLAGGVLRESIRRAGRRSRRAVGPRWADSPRAAGRRTFRCSASATCWWPGAWPRSRRRGMPRPASLPSPGCSSSHRCPRRSWVPAPWRSSKKTLGQRSFA